MPKLGINGTSLDRRFNNPDTIVYKVKAVSENGHVTELVFPLFDQFKAIRCVIDCMNAPDMSFVSIGKEQG